MAGGGGADPRPPSYEPVGQVATVGSNATATAAQSFARPFLRESLLSVWFRAFVAVVVAVVVVVVLLRTSFAESSCSRVRWIAPTSTPTLPGVGDAGAAAAPPATLDLCAAAVLMRSAWTYVMQCNVM